MSVNPQYPHIEVIPPASGPDSRELLIQAVATALRQHGASTSAVHSYKFGAEAFTTYTATLLFSRSWVTFTDPAGGSIVAGRNARALDIAAAYTWCDGDQHKRWVIDQMVRALTGCPDEGGTQGESDAYRAFTRQAGTWDTGITPVTTTPTLTGQEG